MKLICPKQNCRSKARQGIVLVVVLWVLFFLSVTALTLGFKNRIGIRLQSLSNEQMRMTYLAREGINRCVGILAADTNGFDAVSEEWSKNFSLQNEEGLLLCKVIDEDGLLNINTVPREMLQALKTAFPRIDEDMLTALEKARPFNVSREVLDATSLDGQDFYGDPALDKAGLSALITVFSDGRININTAPEEVLALIPEMTETAIEAIVSRRVNAPFEKNETLSEELSLLGLTPSQVSAVVKAGKVDSTVFRIVAEAVSQRRHISKRMEMIVKRQEHKFTILLAKEK